MARAGKGAGNKEPLMPAKRGAAGKCNMGMQLRRPHRDGWTAKNKKRFLEVLKATCNVQEATRSVGLSNAGVYYQRQHDPAFAAGWAEALEQGYAELEMHLLRQSIFGSETTETVDDGKEGGVVKTKKVHSYPHAIALRLMLAHKDSVESYRDAQGIERPGSEAIRAEIQERLAQVRERSGGSGMADDGPDGFDAGERDDDV